MDCNHEHSLNCFDYAVLFVVILLAWPLMLINTPLLWGICLGINSLILAVWSVVC